MTARMAERRAFVTGATGLLGRQVVEAFERPGAGWAVTGSGHSRADGQRIRKVDLLDEGQVGEVLDAVR
jgi:S-adenosylmethionine synthetase